MADTSRRTSRLPIRPIVATVGVVVVSAVTIVGGQMLARQAPAVQAAPADTFASPPGCAVISAELVESVAPAATPRPSQPGPLHEGGGNTCVWSSVGTGEAPPRSLRASFRVHFTDKSGETSGARAATNRLRAVTPAEWGSGVASVPQVGEDALVWPGAGGEGAAELAFRRDNLVVRLWFGGAADSGGAALSYGQARDSVVGVARQLAEAL
ncbi:hypothetical protein [Salinactinospora qingdaonensis]|uniref:DUF3558 domain-containing protein n=1 Tax=Salinactinospora qingdaonensis TaxID=702744 RepID=A0ABP7EY38_9ACTN